MRGQTIKLFVRNDVDAKGFKVAELSNWVGSAYIGQRKHLRNLKSIDELSAPAIYFLLSENADSTQKQLYIGEADDEAQRVTQHAGKDWWDYFVIFVSKDANLTKAHVRVLERNFYDLAIQNLTTIDLKNGTKPPGSKLPDSDLSDMEIFLENMVFLLDNLGIIDFTRTYSDEEAKSEPSGIVFHLELTKDRVHSNGKIADAQLVVTENGYRLLKGSYVESQMRDSFKTHTYFKLRKKLENSGLFVASDVDGCLQLSESIDFNSPSAAASVVKNRATNGKREWVTADGQDLTEYLASNR